MKKDIFNKTPKIGDTIVFNPPKYKGVMSSIIVGFSKAGLPMVNHIPGCLSNSIKTSFVII